MVMIALPENAFSMESLHDAYLKCRKGKRRAVNTRDFEAWLYTELKNLSEALSSGDYRPSRSVCFYVQKPKLREVFAAHFRDRVVHRLLVDILEPEYEKSFIYDSWACRKGKGTHSAVERTKEFLKRGTFCRERPFYYLQLDIKGFFMSIDKQILIRLLAKKIKSDKLLNLCRTVILHNPAESFVFRGKVPPAGALPPHKTLFHDNKQKGIPIGNLTSQFFANVYLNELDQYIKRGLGIKYYLRYVDDFIIMHHEPQKLQDYKVLIIKYIKEKLQLELKDTQVQPVSVYKGIDFLGYFIKPRYTLIRRRVIQNFKKAWKESFPMREINRHQFRIILFPQKTANWKTFQARVNSYLAHSNYSDSYNIKKSIEAKLTEKESLVTLQKGYLRIPRMDRISSYYSQLALFMKKFPNVLILSERGNMLDILGSEAKSIAETLQIPASPCLNSVLCSIKIKDRKANSNLRKYIKDNFVSYTLIKQTKDLGERIKVRLPVVHSRLTAPIQMQLFK